MYQPSVIALGFFDGVHIGHGGLLRRTKARAQALGVKAAAMTFDNSPERLTRGVDVPLLTDRFERERLLRERYRMDEVIVLPFDKTLMAMSWERFLDDILLTRLQARALVCGHDFRFGADGAGTPQKLAAACQARGVGCEVVEKITLDGITVSSTSIRQMIADGDAARARRFLGHPYGLTGRVIHGAALGRHMGTPTANLQISPGLALPKPGVYIARAITADGSFAAVTNIGVRPTVDGGDLRVEAWLLDYAGDLYGQPLRLDLYEFLRPERKFDDLSALREEIMANAAQARAYFSALPETESEEHL